MSNVQVKSSNSTRAYSLVGILSVIALCNNRAAWKAWLASSRESVSGSPGYRNFQAYSVRGTARSMTLASDWSNSRQACPSSSMLWVFRNGLSCQARNAFNDFSAACCAWKTASGQRPASSEESVSTGFQVKLNLLQPGANILGACVIRCHAAFSPRAAPSLEAMPSAACAARSMSGCRQPRQRQHLCREGLHRRACFFAAPVAPRLEPHQQVVVAAGAPRRVLLIQTNIPGGADMLRPDVLQSRPEPGPKRRSWGLFAVSWRGEDLVTNKVKSDAGRFLRTVEIEGCHRFPYVLAKRVPVVGLGDDVFGQALCHKAAVAFLSDFEDNLVHADQITALGLCRKRQWEAAAPANTAGSVARAGNTGHRMRPVFSTSLFFLERTAGGGRSAVHLLGEVILQAQLFDQVELGFEEVNVLLFVLQENLEEIG